jgi:outer membrane protein TolC
VIRAKQSLIESEADLLLAKLQLNTFLNNSLEDDFDIRDLSLDDNLFNLFATSSLSKSISSPASFTVLTDFLVEEAKSNFPTKKQLAANMTALERQIQMNKRLFYTPTLALTGQIDQNLYRGGLGANPLPGQEFFNTTWNTGVTLTYPIFDGYRRKIALDKSNIQQEQIQYQMTNLDVNIALNVQKNMLNVLTSQTQISNSENVAINAEKNFEIVQNNYKAGTVNITQLIDAQQTMIGAKQTYSLSIYNYMVNFLILENSLGMYSMLLSKSEQVEFENRFETFKDNY